jgi:hypothetical protein
MNNKTIKKKKRAEHVLPGRQGEEVAQTIYTHVSKCKNDKIKGERKINKTLKKILNPRSKFN